MFLKHAEATVYSMIFRKNRQSEAERELTQAFPSLWRFSLTLTGRPDLADDLAQATSVRVLEKQAQFTPGTNFRAWCFTLCRTIWLNELRREAIRRTEGLEAVRAEDMPAGQFDAETNIFVTQVFNEVMGLPEAIRNTVGLVYVEGFTYREAAEILEVPIGTVMSRLAAARKRLAPLKETDARIGQRTEK